jgi:hypothetical protein
MSLGRFGKAFSIKALALAILLAPMAVISIPAPSAEAQFYIRIPFGMRFHGGGGRHHHYSHSARVGRHHSHHARAPSRSHRSTASSGGGGGKSGKSFYGTTD